MISLSNPVDKNNFESYCIKSFQAEELFGAEHSNRHGSEGQIELPV